MPQSANRLGRTDLIDGLRDLVQRLHGDGQRTGVYLIGGAALSLRYIPDRGLTDDIDAKIHPSARALEYALEIADNRGWGGDWLNTHAETYIPIAKDPAWETLYDDGCVSVWVASPECLLAMKLKASRPGRDDDDIAVLLTLVGINSADEAEELFEEYFPGEILQPRAFDILDDIFHLGLPRAPATPPAPELGPSRSN